MVNWFSYCLNYIFDINDCQSSQWITLVTFEETEDYINVGDCVLCVTGNYWPYSDGTYIWSHYDESLNGNVFFCILCNRYLYQMFTTYWVIYNDYSDNAAYSYCYTNPQLNTMSILLNDCNG